MKMNVPRSYINVTCLPRVQTSRDRTVASVIRATREMESYVKVNNALYIYTHRERDTHTHTRAHTHTHTQTPVSHN